MFNRRELGKAALASLAAPLFGAFRMTSRDLHLGVQTSSFGTLKRATEGDQVAAIIEALTACRVRDCELFAPQVEARFGSEHAAHHGMSAMAARMNRRELRKWRLRTPISYFRGIGDRFAGAGIAISAYHYSPNGSFTDEEIDRGFEMAKALGAGIVTASTTLDVARRMAPAAERHRMIVALRGSSIVKTPNELGTPESFAAATSLSTYFKVSLDIGDFTAANFDALAFVRDRHADIASLRLKDRRRNQGENVPWGQGDTPIREVLRLVSAEAWPIRAYVDYDYGGTTGPVDEVKKCLAYATQALM
jgi:hypothetical protein